MNLGFTRIQDSMVNEQEYVELGLSCADICRALDRGMSGKKLDDLSQSVCEAISQLTTWVKPVIHRLDDSTMLLIAELWRKSGGRSSNGVDGTQSPGFYMRRTTRKRLPLGSWTSIGSSMFSMCVQSYFCLVAANRSLSDRVGDEHPCNCFRHST